MAWVQSLQRIATGRRVLLMLAVAMAFNVWFFTIGPYGQMQDHGGILDERFGDSGQDHLDAIDAMGQEGRADYRAFLVADFVYPLLQALWMTGLLAWVSRRWRAFPSLLLLAPALAWVSDGVENLAFLGLLAQHPSGSLGLAKVAVVFQWSKLIWTLVSVMAAASYVVHLVMNPVRRRR